MFLRLIRLLSIVLLLLIIVCAVGIALIWNNRPGMELVEAHALPAAEANWRAGEVRIAWLGVSTLLISDQHTRILIDPFVSRPPLLDLVFDRPLASDPAVARDWLARAGMDRLDLILAGHSHYDHLMDVGSIAGLTGAQLLGSASTVNAGIGHGMSPDKTEVAVAGKPYAFGQFTVRYIESRHAGATGGQPLGDISVPLATPARASEYRQGGSYSILIEHPSGSVLYHGSAGHLTGALAPYRADVVLLGIALIDDLPSYLQNVVDAVGARRVIPVHWDDFTRPLSVPISPMPAIVDLPQFFEQLRTGRKDLSVQTLELARPTTLFLPGSPTP